jgi:hypothetical protein
MRIVLSTESSALGNRLSIGSSAVGNPSASGLPIARFAAPHRKKPGEPAMHHDWVQAFMQRLHQPQAIASKRLGD